MNVRLSLKDGFLEIDPFPDELKDELRYWKKVLAWNPETHKREVSGHYESLWSEVDGKAVAMPGHTHRVLEFFRARGDSIAFEDMRTPFPEPDMERAMDGLRDYQKEVVAKMLAAQGGILHASTGLGKTFMTAKLIDAFSPEELKLRGTPISVFAAPSKDITRKNAEELRAVLPHREVGLVMSGVNQFSDDIQVITLDSLHRLDPSEVGLLIVDEMHTAASDSHAEELMKFTKARKYGVSATPTGRFDGKDDVAEGIFGPVVVKKTYKDGVAAGALVPIEVVWVNSPEPTVGMARYLAYKTRDGKIGAGSIGNQGQNRIIASILNGLPEGMQCLVITQFIEHMYKIWQHCGSDVVYAHAQTTSKGLEKYRGIKPISNKERKDIYAGMASGELKKVISTHIFKQGVNFVHLNVVVNASGGGSDIAAAQIPGRASRKADGKDKAFMVEFWHPWDRDGEGKSGPLLAADRQRRRVYTELGFKQTWIEPSQLPFAEFMRA